MGGYSATNNVPTYYDGVWSSTDGAAWTLAAATVPFGPRFGLGCVAFAGELWVIGGSRGDGLAQGAFAWHSGDGVNWTAIDTAPPFGYRLYNAVTVFNNRMWIAGGTDSTSATLNDVWSTPDGLNWTRETQSGPFPATQLAGDTMLLPYLGQLVVMTASRTECVWGEGRPAYQLWRSSDGRSWQPVAVNNLGIRNQPSVFPMAAGILLVAGQTFCGGTYSNDVNILSLN